MFERVTAGIRPARPGAIVAELARGILREVGDSEEVVAAAQAGRTGRFRITAAPLRMQAVLAPVVQAFRAAGADVATLAGPGSNSTVWPDCTFKLRVPACPNTSRSRHEGL